MDVINYWLSDKKKWFESNKKKRDEIDLEISEKFKNQLQVLEEYEMTVFYSMNIIDLISSIIILDQFSRHIYRNNSVFKIKENTLKASKLSIMYLEGLNHDYYIRVIDSSNHIICYNEKIESVFKHHETMIMDISPDLMTFILMPLKHSNILHHWSFIKRTLIKFKYTEHNALFRFYKDTVKKVTIKNNDICVTESIHEKSFDDKWNNITDFFPLQFQHTGSFFKKCVKNHELWINNPLITIVKDFLDKFLSKEENNPNISISLSGGVDSMVLTFVLALIQQTKTSYPFTLQSIHLNYKNRNESDEEVKLVVWFCNQLEIPIFVRTIHEIQRKDNKRDFYEELTRTIRFDLYAKLPTSLLQNNSFVILGHNHDDIVENIWTNFAKGNYLFNLKKMQDVDLQEKVVILRPLLNTKKDLIYSFSNEFNIAYLCNTTPDWSNRGKMRNIFLPAADKQFLNSSQNIEYVADTLSEYGDFLNETLFGPILEQMIVHNNLYQLPVQKKHIKLGLHFWITLFEHILHPINIKEPSRKSIMNFLDKIRNHNSTKQNYIKCNLSGNITAYYLYDEESLKLYINAM